MRVCLSQSGEGDSFYLLTWRYQETLVRQSAGGPGFMILAQGSQANQSESEADRTDPRPGWPCDKVVCTHCVCLLSNLQRKKQSHTHCLNLHLGAAGGGTKELGWSKRFVYFFLQFHEQSRPRCSCSFPLYPFSTKSLCLGTQQRQQSNCTSIIQA